MKRAPAPKAATRRNISAPFFGLADESAARRTLYRTVGAIGLWFVLSGITLLLTMLNVVDTNQRIVLVGMSFFKYIPLLIVAYTLAKAKAAYYLDDIFELGDQSLAESFMEDVAFGGGGQMITIDEGKISESDEHSPIILIGGPGKIKVNLGSAALLEKVDGEPEVIYARSEPWPIGRFERIREIGKDDEVGRREYAAINLRDQFVGGLSVKSRTKDGIPIEAKEIKIIFSILRKKPEKEDIAESDPYSFDPHAVQDLVYKQTIITPPPSTPTGVTFPWDTSVIPLIIYEIEKLITSNTLSEILASISQKELDTVVQNEETIAQKRVEMTGIQQGPTKDSNPLPPFMTRSKITAQFFSPDFKEKAAKLGVAIHWIDIGTWQLPDEIILENLKQAWTLARENTRRRNALKRIQKKHELEFLIELINAVIIVNFERPSSPSVRLTDRDLDELTKMFENSSEVIAPLNLRKQIAQQGSKRDAHVIALEILKAFRRELIAARELIKKEDSPTNEKQADLLRIEKAIQDIGMHVSHTIKRNL